MILRIHPVWVLFSLVGLFSPGSITSPTKEIFDTHRQQISSMVDQLDYAEYAKEVLKLLQSDDSFNTKINKNIVNMNSPTAHIAKHLHTVPEHIRTKLDEVKRLELDRIKKLGTLLKQKGSAEEAVKVGIKAASAHLDMRELGKFGAEDLKRLILESNKNILLLDLMRKQRFKEYEMMKRLEMEELLKREDPMKQVKIKEKIHKVYMDHRKVKPIHMPMSKAHLLKVWEERDHMNKDNFNIRTFFNLHDLDDNGFLDEYEIKALIQSEIMGYSEETGMDPKQKQEELERMREYTFNHVDTNKDHLVTLEEFLQHIRREGMDDDHYWQTLNKDMQYTPEEYEKYAKLNREEVNKWIDEGLITLPDSGIVQHNEPKEKSPLDDEVKQDL